ncbi:hypothetical protein [Nitratireductor rhodophyticola]|uniref:hypothetical protein n=1 Tax=Nitratireductor rhodophyticola TaxID=2854036 RepID=UPI003BA89198
MSRPQECSTPWQRVYAKFGLTQSQLAKSLGRHKSKISRALKDEKGLISGRDQEALFSLAKSLKVNLSPEDVTPGR